MFVSKARSESVSAASELFQGMSPKELERFETALEELLAGP